MCKTIIEHAEDWPDSKSHRWIGYVQAGMIANLMIDVRTARTMFNKLREQFGALSNDQDLLDHLDSNTAFEIETGGQVQVLQREHDLATHLLGERIAYATSFELRTNGGIPVLRSSQGTYEILTANGIRVTSTDPDAP
jgi:hypothetical protein